MIWKMCGWWKYLETEVDSTINIFVVSSVILQIIIIFYTNGKTDICFVFRHLSYGSSIDYYRFFFFIKVERIFFGIFRALDILSAQ